MLTCTDDEGQNYSKNESDSRRMAESGLIFVYKSFGNEVAEHQEDDGHEKVNGIVVFMVLFVVCGVGCGI